MIISLTINELKVYIAGQLGHFFPDRYAFSGNDVDSALNLGLQRTEYCFKHITLPAYIIDGETSFSHLHSDQYSMFLYFLSNSLWNISQNKPLCDKLILLNKTLNGMFFSYKTNLPDIFLFQHPVGSVIGNAKYSDFFVISQSVTINTERDENGNAAPFIGKGVFLAAGAKILGNKSIGDRSSIGANVVIYNREVPPDSIAFKREDGSLAIVPRGKPCCIAQYFFNMPIV